MQLDAPISMRFDAYYGSMKRIYESLQPLSFLSGKALNVGRPIG